MAYEKLSPGELSVRDGFNLGYLLSWSSHSSLVGELTRVCEQGTELNLKYKDVNSLELSRSVDGRVGKFRPKNAQEAAELKDEFLCRLSMIPLDAEVDVEVHILLDCPRYAQEYIDYYSKDLQ